MLLSAQTCVICAVCLISSVWASPIERAPNNDQLPTQLGKLKTLLQRLEMRKHASTDYSNKDMGPPPLLKHSEASESKPDREPTVDEGREVTEDEVRPVEEDKIKSFVDSLSTEDLEELKVLKKMVDEAKADISTKRTQDVVHTQDKTDTHVEAETEEGTFGPFRDEIKYSIEKNLLSDLALAVHSGISVDEILADLVQPDKPEETAVWSRSAEEE